MRSATTSVYIVVRKEAGRLCPSPNPATHDDFQTAKREAARLAGLHKGTEFHVFAARGHAAVRDPVDWTDHTPSDDEIPF